MSPQALHAGFQVVALAMGLSVGSFLNVCIARMPEDRSVVRPPSHCPVCGHRIRARDNVPVLSWLLLRGRCRDCGHPISPLYPAIELLTGLLALLLFRHLVPGPGHLDAAALGAWCYYLVFLACLVGATFVDLRHYIIPDTFSIGAVPVGVIGSALLRAAGSTQVPTWRASLGGAALGAGVLGGVMLAWWLVRREEGMGLGDVKLLAMIGSFLGALPAVPVVVLLSSVIGSVVGLALVLTRRKGLRAQVPFGPFLALAALVQLFFGPQLVAAWLPALARP